jgi:predicted ester cyclase
VSIEENKELVRRQIEQTWNEHNIGKLAEFVGEDLLDESREHVRQFLGAFPDVRVTILDMIAEGDKVVARLEATATNTGSFAGRPATGKKIKLISFRIYRVAGGKIVETWAMQDRMGLMEQLGFISSSGEINWAAGEQDE